MSAIDLLLDEENELTFQLNIEGNSPGSAKCRLKLENKEVGLLFESYSQQKGEISVMLPPLSHVLEEGEYKMVLEVVVDDKFFEPLTLTGNFEKSVKVTAESVVRTSNRKKTSVSASVLSEDRAPITVRNSRTRKQAPRVVTESSQRSKVTDSDIMRLINALKKS